MAIKPIKIKIFGVDLFSSKLASVGKRLKNTGKAFTRVGRSLTLGATVPAVLFGASVLNAAGNFESAMKTVGVVAKQVGERSLSDLSDKAELLGRTTQFSATQAANAMAELSKAGLNTTQVFDASTGVLQLAGAGQIEMAEASKLAAKTMNIFSKEATDIGDIADVLTRGFTAAPTSIQELATALTFGGAASSGMGEDLRSTVAALAAFAQQGEISTLGGAKLRKVMNSLADPTEEAKNAFRRLLINEKDVFNITKDGTKTFKGFANLVKQLEGSLFDVTAASQIFGQRAGPVMFKIVQKGSENLANLRAALDNVGITAKKVSDVNLEGFKGQMRLLVSAFEGFQIAVGRSGILTFATKLAKKFTALFSSLAIANPRLLKLGFIILTVVGVLGPLVLLIGGLISAFGVLAITFAIISGLIALGISAISLPVLGIIAAIAALGLAVTFIILKWRSFLALFKRIPRPLKMVLGPITLLIDAAKVLSNNWNVVVSIFKRVFNIVTSIANAFSKMEASIASFAFGKLSGFLGKFGLLPSQLEKPTAGSTSREESSGADRLFKSVLSKLDGTLSRVEVAFKNEPPGLRVDPVIGGANLAIERGPSSGGR